MLTSQMFSKFLENLKIPNERQKSIARHYRVITKNLNKTFRGTDDGQSNRLKVGSAGRRTAIKNTSDLDMLYIMKPSDRDEYRRGENPQRRILRDLKNSLKGSYPGQEVKVDRLVVQIVFSSFHIEVQPVFENADGSFDYPDSYGGGQWKLTKPRLEIEEMRRFRKDKSKNIHPLCRMIRAWKNRNTIDMGGLLIDTLAWRFLNQTDSYDNVGLYSYGLMCRDFFGYLKDEEHKDYYAALGSRQRVKVYKKFQKAAQRAFELCEEALEAHDEGKEKKSHDLWRKVFGVAFPSHEALDESLSKSIDYTSLPSQNWRDTEEFPDEKFDDIDIRYPLDIICTVKQNGYLDKPLWRFLDELTRRKLPLAKKLHFSLDRQQIDLIGGEYHIYWKVLNRGEIARRKDRIRGQISLGNITHNEHTDFHGDHKVWCYIVQNNVVIASASIDIPIE